MLQPSTKNYRCLPLKVVHFIAIAMLLTTVASCSKAVVTSGNADVDLKKLNGKWRWVSSTGGFAGRTITPQTEGYNLSVEFKSGNKEYRFRNDSLIAQRTFNIVKGQSIFSAGENILLKHTDGIDQVVMKAKVDTLVLADNVNDGFASTYVK